MIGAAFGKSLDRFFSPFVKRLNVTPNTLTVSGFLLSAAASLVLMGNLRKGALFLMAASAFDLFDGMVARAHGKTSEFGAFLDSVLDRYSDALIFLAIAWNMAARGDHTSAFLSLGTLVGAFMISYARARAEGLGKKCNVGVMERAERLMLVVLGGLTGWMAYMLWALFALTHITALQRIVHVWRITRGEKTS